MLDVTEQLQRYSTALGDLVPESDFDRRRRPTFHFPAVAAIVAVVVIAVSAGVWVTATDGGDSSVATQSPGNQLPVPADGAAPEQLPDGTPVWVVHHDDGSVSVLDAVSTHRPFGAGNLVVWCESSRGFLDPMYGSTYDEHGLKQAGPAPTGLDTYLITRIGGDTATVTGPPSAQPRELDGGRKAAEPAGPHCIDQGDHVDSYITGTFDMHSLASSTPMTVEEAMRQPDGTLVVIDAPVLIPLDDDEPVVCTSDIAHEPLACEGVPAPELASHGQPPVVIRGIFIARPHQGTLTDVAYVAERRAEYQR